MTTTTLKTATTSTSQNGKSKSIPYWIAAAVILWFAISLNAAHSGFFRATPGQPPLGFLVGIGIPVAVFFLIYTVSTAFRAFIRNLDPVTLTLIQSWRVVGSTFMILYFLDMLPAFFAYPAGLGDMAIGITAPFIALKLLRDTTYGQSRKFVIWNALGLFDFVVAVGTGTLASGTFGTFFTSDGPTTALMASLPLAMIPGFIVPLYILLHISALIGVGTRRKANAY